MNERTEPIWIAALDGTLVVAVQHGCAGDGRPVNAFIDEYHNWQCPRCMEIYGAIQPLAGWYELSMMAKVMEQTKQGA